MDFTREVVLCADGPNQRALLHEAGLLAAQRAAVKVLPHQIALEDIHIYKDERGKPYAKAHASDRTIAISISHCFPYALGAATLSWPHIGVDVERIREFAPEVSEAFLTPREREAITNAVGATRAWTLKEATLKALGTGLRLHPGSVDIAEALEHPGETDISITLYGISVPAQVWQGALDEQVLAAAILLPNFRYTGDIPYLRTA